MDVCRNGYTADMQLWQDDPRTVRVRWFRADPAAEVLPYPTPFCSSNWDDNYWNPLIGEVKGSDRGYTKGQNFAGYRGVAPCGPTDAIMFGGVHGVTPPIVTRADGTSTCCALPDQQGTAASGSGLRGAQRRGGLVVTGTGMASNQGPPLHQESLIASGSGTNGYQSEGHEQFSLIGSGSGVESITEIGYVQPSLIASGSGLESYQEVDVSVTGDFKASYSPASQPGWLLCDGSAVSQTTYHALYALIGTTFGPSTGGMFTLPDCRGRVIVGAGNGSGLTARSPGDKGGEETHTLISAEVPPSDVVSPADGVNAYWYHANGQSGTGIAAPVAYDASQTGAGPLQVVGGGGAHNNMQPWLCVGYLFIKT